MEAVTQKTVIRALYMLFGITAVKKSEKSRVIYFFFNEQMQS